MNEVCEHGHQRRKCEVCERDKRIAELEESVRVLAVDLARVPELVSEAAMNNPIAAAAVRKASDGNG